MAGGKIGPAGGPGRIMPDHKRSRTREQRTQVGDHGPCSTPRKHLILPRQHHGKNTPLFFFLWAFFFYGGHLLCFVQFPMISNVFHKAEVRKSGLAHTGTQRNSHAQQPCLSGAGARYFYEFLIITRSSNKQTATEQQSTSLLHNISKVFTRLRGRRSILEMSVII